MVGEAPTSVVGVGRLTMSEGRHAVQVSGPVEESLEVDLSAGFFDRWFKKPAWILNPKGEAVLDEMTVYYAERPRPAVHRFISGQSFVSRPHIDYLFEELPQTMEIDKRKESQIAKTVIRWLHEDDDKVFLAELGTDRNGALEFAERRLRRKPDQSRLLVHYMQQATEASAPRIEEFLKSGLGRRPVIVSWHRTYQMVAEMNGHDEGMAAQYDGYLRSEPKNGALLYLPADRARRGRSNRSLPAGHRRRSRAALALAGGRPQAAAETRWDECLRASARPGTWEWRKKTSATCPHQAGLATGQARALVDGYRNRLAFDSTRVSLLPQLCDALIASGQGERIPAEVGAWQARLPAELRSQIAEPL